MWTGRRQELKAYQIRIKDVSKTFTGVHERCLPGESAVPFPGLAAFPSLFPVVFPVFPVKIFLPNVLPVTVLVGGLKKRWKIMVKKFGKGGIIALSLHPLLREMARGKEVKRGDGKKVWKKSLKSLENEKQALPLQPLSRRWHEGMTGATRWKKEFFKILKWTKRSERESRSTRVEIHETHDPARTKFL